MHAARYQCNRRARRPIVPACLRSRAGALPICFRRGGDTGTVFAARTRACAAPRIYDLAPTTGMCMSTAPPASWW